MSSQTRSDPFVTCVRDRTDFISVVSDYVVLKKVGRDYTGLCPFHAEKRPSFTVSSEKQLFYCFGCGAGGDLFEFMEKMEGLSFKEALHHLAKKVGVPIPEYREGGGVASENVEIYRVNEEAMGYYHHVLCKRPEAAVARAYLAGRGISDETIRAFSVGFALPERDGLIRALKGRFNSSQLEAAGLLCRGRPGQTPSDDYDRFRNRVLFPIRTSQKKVVGFGGRVMDSALPKYLNTPETAVFKKGSHLFGLDQGGTRRDAVIMVEGYFDAISARQAGIPNVVATLGTALTEDHLQLARRVSNEIILVFDPDEAGTRAALRAVPLIAKCGMLAKVVSLPSKLDPDLFIRKQGKDAFMACLKGANTLIEFAIRTLGKDARTIEERRRVIQELMPMLHPLKSPVERGHYARVLADVLGLTERDIRAEWGRARQVSSISPVAPGGHLAIVKRPVDEETLVGLLIRGEINLSAWVGRIVPDDFSDPHLREIVSVFWNTETKAWSLSEQRGTHTVGWEGISDTARLLVTRLSVAGVVYDDAEQTGSDCLRSLCVKRLQQESRDVQRKLKSAEAAGDAPSVRVLQRKFFDIKKALSGSVHRAAVNLGA